MRIVIVAMLVALTSGCAVSILNSQPKVIDEYSDVTVRIRYGNFGCVIEVVTVRDVVTTGPTTCTKVPRVAP